MTPFFTILTNYGKTVLAEALAAQKKLEIPYMAVGDGGGGYYEPVEEQTNLRNERWRGELNDLRSDDDIQGQVIAEAIIPHDIDGDWTAREVGLYDKNGGLIAVGKYPETYIPPALSGAKSQIYINIIIKVDNVGAVQLIVDHGQVLASKLFVLGKGFGIVGSFESGLMEIKYLSNPYQLVLFKQNNSLYYWDGEFPKEIPSGSSPQSTGGIGAGSWAKLSGDFPRYTTVNNMLNDKPMRANIGDVVSTGGTLWLREKDNGALSDFRPLSVIDISDWGALGIADDTVALQAGIDYADSISHPCTAPTSAKFKISKGLTFKNSGFALSQINLVAMSGFDGDAMIVSEYSGTGNSRINVKLKKLNLDCAENVDLGYKFSGIGQGSCFNDFNITNCITGGVFVGCWAGEVANLRIKGRGKDLGGAGISMGVPGTAKPGFSGTNQVNMMYIHGGAISHVYDAIRIHYGAMNIATGIDIEYCNVGLEARYPNALIFAKNYIEMCTIASFQLGSTSTTTLPKNCVIEDNYINMCGDAKFKCGTDCKIGQNQFVGDSKLSLNTTAGSTSTGNLFIINRNDIQPQTGDLDMSKNRLMTINGAYFRAGINSNVGQHVDNGATYVFDSYGNVRCKQLFRLDDEDCINVGLLSNTNPDYYTQAIKGNIRLGGVSSVKPIFDNANSLGEPSQRWKDGYFVNAPTVSSDKNLKTTPEAIPEAMLSPLLEIIDNIVLWKWISSVNEKGDNARKHAGIIAQDVYAIFSRHNIDAFEYGFIGRDKTDNGEIWSVRASELQWLCLWAIRKRQSIVEDKLTMLIPHH